MTRFAVCDKEEAVIRVIDQYRKANEMDITLYPFKDGTSLEKGYNWECSLMSFFWILKWKEEMALK